jgi:hypothetical protein
MNSSNDVRAIHLLDHTEYERLQKTYLMQDVLFHADGNIHVRAKGAGAGVFEDVNAKLSPGEFLEYKALAERLCTPAVLRDHDERAPRISTNPTEVEHLKLEFLSKAPEADRKYAVKLERGAKKLNDKGKLRFTKEYLLVSDTLADMANYVSAKVLRPARCAKQTQVSQT